jgi:hypothetical protein
VVLRRFGKSGAKPASTSVLPGPILTLGEEYRLDFRLSIKGMAQKPGRHFCFLIREKYQKCFVFSDFSGMFPDKMF